MMLVQFLVDAFPPIRRKVAFLDSSGLLSSGELPVKEGDRRDKGMGPMESEEALPSHRVGGTAGVWWQISRIVLWLVAFVFLLAHTNYLVAVGAFIVLVTKFEKGESWKRSILLGLCVNLGFFILFELLLKAQL